MMQSVKHALSNPNDVPDVPRSVKEYLQARYNSEYLYEHLVPMLQKQGHSELFISGVIFGHYQAAKVIDEIEVRRLHLEADDQ